MPQNSYWQFASILSTAFPDFYSLGGFCFRQYCTTEYPWWLRSYTGDHPEYWADGFSAWIHFQTQGTAPVGWREKGYPVATNWGAIYSAVEYSLAVTFDS
jgi:hypothetical protein